MTFELEYRSNTSSLWSTAVILVVLAIVLSGIWTILDYFNWQRSNVREGDVLLFDLSAFLHLCTCSSLSLVSNQTDWIRQCGFSSRISPRLALCTLRASSTRRLMNNRVLACLTGYLFIFFKFASAVSTLLPDVRAEYLLFLVLCFLAQVRFGFSF